MALIFLSYSSKDQEVANRLFDYFSFTFALSKDDIFLSSVNVGAKHSEEVIIPALKDSSFLVFLISENFLQSTYCLCELGAAWILKKEFYFLLDGISRNDERILHLPPYLREKNSVIIHSGDKISVAKYFENMLNDISKVRKSTPTPSVNIMDLAQDLAYEYEPDISIDFRQVNPFHNPESTSETLKIDQKNTSFFSAIADYMTIKPNFAGVMIPLMNYDWTDKCKHGYSLCFDVISSEPLTSLIMEVKRFVNGSMITFAKEKINVGAKRQWKRRLDDLASIENYRDLAEIVFLIEPSTFNAYSKFTISNMQITK